MKLSILVFISSLLFLSACKKNNTLEVGSEDCPLIADAKILAPEELPCNYNLVYLFGEELYTTCICCACFKATIAMDCEGQPLCEVETIRECMDDFYKNAIYLYAIEEF